MIGFIIGTACLVGLIATVRRARYGYGACGGGGWGGHHYGHRHQHGGGGEHEHRHHQGWGGWGRGGGFGPRAILRALFQRLDTTPGQEKVIAEAFDEVRDAAEKAKREVKESRKDLGKSFRNESFDAVHMGEVFSRHDNVIEEVRKAMVGALSKVHDVLDQRQRAILADVIEEGWFRSQRSW